MESSERELKGKRSIIQNLDSEDQKLEEEKREIIGGAQDENFYFTQIANNEACIEEFKKRLIFLKSDEQKYIDEGTKKNTDHQDIMEKFTAKNEEMAHLQNIRSKSDKKKKILQKKLDDMQNLTKKSSDKFEKANTELFVAEK
jgi:hypothetical protein